MRCFQRLLKNTCARVNAHAIKEVIKRLQDGNPKLLKNYLTIMFTSSMDGILTSMTATKTSSRITLPNLTK